MNPYGRFAVWLGSTPFFAWLGPNVIRPLDSFAKATGIPNSALGLPFDLVYLTTTGHRSGAPRKVPLLGLSVDEGVVVVGTNWGGEHDPGWVQNLRADPGATLERDGTTSMIVATPVFGSAFEENWRRLVELWPPYAVYRERTDREIPMFRLSESPP